MRAQRVLTRYVGVYLPADVYTRLEQAAEAQERDPVQHVRWLLKQALLDGKTIQDTHRLPVEAGATK
jgi:hypothetical protein